MSADGVGLSTAEACAYALEQISFFAYHRDNSPLLPDGGLAESDKRIAHKERLRAERVEKEAQALEDYTVANWHDLTKSRATTSGAAAGLIEIVQPGDVNRRIQTL